VVARALHAWHGSVFAHPDAVAACLPALAPGSSILALTADGGALLEHVLARNPTVRPLDPRTTLAADAAGDAGSGEPVRPDVVLLADVLHHIPPAEREDYLRTLRKRAGDDALFIVKEFAPGGARSRLGWLTDRALSGDPVRFLPPFELRALAARALPGLVAVWTSLFASDPPNYCFVFGRLDFATRNLTGR
jgi:hypothetical protein